MPPKRKSTKRNKIALSPESLVKARKAVTEKSQSRRKAAAENKAFLQNALSSVLQKNDVQDHSESGHLFVGVKGTTSTAENEVKGEACDPLDPSSQSQSSKTRPIEADVHSEPMELNASSDGRSETPIRTVSNESPRTPTLASIQSSSENDSPFPPNSRKRISAAITSPVSPAPLTAVTPKRSTKSGNAPKKVRLPSPQPSTSGTQPVIDYSPSLDSVGPAEPVAPELEPPSEICELQEATPRSEPNRNDQEPKKMQSENLKLTRAKNKKLVQENAQLKDLLVHAVADAQKAREGDNAKTKFTTDPDIPVSLEELENINKISKHTGAFSQNLALRLYGADELRRRSVKGKRCNRIKDGRPARPPLTPKKLAFIHDKVREKVAMEVGHTNIKQINLFANEYLVNKAISEKIANLNKAIRYAQSRNATHTT